MRRLRVIDSDSAVTVNAKRWTRIVVDRSAEPVRARVVAWRDGLQYRLYLSRRCICKPPAWWESHPERWDCTAGCAADTAARWVRDEVEAGRARPVRRWPRGEIVWQEVGDGPAA